MKNYILLFVFLTGLLSGCQMTKRMPAPDAPPPPPPVPQSGVATTAPAQFNYHDQTTFLLGYFSPSMLKKEPHSNWFMKGYDEYMPSSQAMNNLLDISQDGITIKVVMGTWCPDSRREVPRFMKIIDTWHFPEDKITFIGVNEDKISPIGDFDKLLIERVPTFIFYKNNVETGRIIEVPKASLEQDMVNILTGMNK